ncbi:MAG: hypothetical protein ACRDF4_00550 [Rhabdochlamydiaceae bacterium]
MIANGRRNEIPAKPHYKEDPTLSARIRSIEDKKSREDAKNK